MSQVDCDTNIQNDNDLNSQKKNNSEVSKILKARSRLISYDSIKESYPEDKSDQQLKILGLNSTLLNYTQLKECKDIVTKLQKKNGSKILYL